MTPAVQRLLTALAGLATPLLFAAVLLAFAALSPKFLTAGNLTNVLVQASSTAVVATGMTFVLLTAGVDLSVGALMAVGAACAGKLLAGGAPVPVAVAVMLGVGAAGGLLNALLVTRLRLLPFVATLGVLYAGRGLGLWITQTRAINLPDGFAALATARWLGVPLPLWVLGAVVLAAHTVLTRTPFGRQVYAVGHGAEAARKAGVPVGRILAAVYVICGLCAGLGGVLALARLGAVSPKFGENYEFSAIAAAVLGGTSLFGGRGRVWPGTVLGALLIQTVENGLVILNADPYLYPLVTGGIIFLAVLVDAGREGLLRRLRRRRVYAEDPPG